MIVIQNNDGQTQRSTLLVFIEPDNLVRMAEADPLTLMPQFHGGALSGVAFPYNLRVVIAYEPEPGKLHEMVQARASFEEFIRYAERGYKFKAPDGLRITREGGSA